VVPIVEPTQRIDALIEEKRALSSITQCVVGVNSIFFSDGTLWISGVYLAPTATHPINTPAFHVKNSSLTMRKIPNDTVEPECAPRVSVSLAWDRFLEPNALELMPYSCVLEPPEDRQATQNNQ
jgi:hypothetical protein